MVETWGPYALALMAGLIAGSFTTTLIHRMPKMQAAEVCDGSDAAGTSETLNMWLPASHCPACLTPLGVRDLLPLVSWLSLRGRCRHCGQHIPPMYPLVEASLALLACLLVMAFGFGVQALAGLIFVTFLLALAVIDARTLTLPDALTLSLLWLGLLFNVMEMFTDLASAVIGAFAGYAILWLLFQAHRLIRGVDGMGYGDFKLLAAIGAWLGWQDLPAVVLIASMTGLIWALLRWKKGAGRLSGQLPFAPFLALGGLAGLFIQGPIEWIRL